MLDLVPKWIRRTALAGALLSFAALPQGHATDCVAVSGHCAARLILVEYDDEPTTVCLLGHPVVQIASKAVCPAGAAGPVVVLRCGALDTPIVYSGSGRTHTIGTTSSWEDVLWGACGDVTYSVSTP